MNKILDQLNQLQNQITIYEKLHEQALEHNKQFSELKFIYLEIKRLKEISNVSLQTSGTIPVE